MIFNILLTWCRTATRHPLYTALNLLAFSLGIAVFVTLSLFVRFETGFEDWIPAADHLYVVNRTFFGGNSYHYDVPRTVGSLLDDLRQDDPGIEGTRLWQQELTVQVDGRATRETGQLVDADFLRLFDLPLAGGEGATALARPDQIVITQAMAVKYFGTAPALGRTLTVSDQDGTGDYVVSAILRTPPASTDLHLDFIRLLTPRRILAEGRAWHDYSGYQPMTIVALPTAQAAAHLNARLDGIVDARAGSQLDVTPAHQVLRLRVVPLKSLHLADGRDTVMALGLVGGLALLIAAINYVNLATARAGMRAREVAIRKTLGATRLMLRGQFLMEAILTSLLSMVIGLSLVELTLPLINTYGGLTLDLDLGRDWSALLGLIMITAVVGGTAGVYPALLLSSFPPATVLAASRTPAGGKLGIRVREALVVAQFSVVTASFILVAGIVSQIHHVESGNLGFQRDGLLISTSFADSALGQAQRTALLNAIQALPGVTAVAASSDVPGDGGEMNNNAAALDGQNGWYTHIGAVKTSPQFLTVYGARLLAGRRLDPAHGADLVADETGRTLRNIVLNRRAVATLGLASPQAALDKVLHYGPRQELRVVGVVDDMRFGPPRAALLPALYELSPELPEGPLSIRYLGPDEAAMRTRIAEVWRHIAPGVPLTLVSASDNLDRYYRPDRNRAHMLNIGAGVAAVIGCVGLYGMAAFNTSRRRQEIGLRKVLGATEGAVVRLLVIQFMRPVLIANILAWPMAYWGLERWLQQFDDRVPLGIGYFLIGSGIALLIALLTVIGLAFASASTAPGQALRKE